MSYDAAYVSKQLSTSAKGIRKELEKTRFKFLLKLCNARPYIHTYMSSGDSSRRDESEGSGSEC